MKKSIKNTLKTILLFIFIVPFMISLCACSNGKSAYELALENGFQGTVQEWLDSLKGIDGQDGKNGSNGKDAPQETSYELWQQAVEKEGYTKSFLEFINEELSICYDTMATVANKCMTSVVSIQASNHSGLTNAGSGVIYSIDANNNAFIITNYHVTYCSSATSGHYSNYKLNFYGNDNSNAFSATFVGGSETYDIAILYAENCTALENYGAKAAIINTNDVKFGTDCFAIGNADNEGLSFTEGKISVDSEWHENRVGTYIKSRRFIRHSATITNGNSGGGLFNSKGELIGIACGGLKSDSSQTTFAYLAIPSSIVYGITENIISNCFNKDNYRAKLINTELSFGISSTTYPCYNATTGVIDINDTIVLQSTGTNSFSLNIGDQLIKAELASQERTITKNIDRLFNINDFMLLANNNDTLKLTIKRDGVQENLTIEINLSSLEQIEIR